MVEDIMLYSSKGFGQILLSGDNVAKTWPSNGVAGHSLCLLLPSELVGFCGGKGAYYTYNKLRNHKAL
jgi:hypothetical protein